MFPPFAELLNIRVHYTQIRIFVNYVFITVLLQIFGYIMVISQ